MMEKRVISLCDGVIRDENRRFCTPMNFSMNRGEQIAVIGVNGSGKSLLADLLEGSLPLRSGELTYDLPGSGHFAAEGIRRLAFSDAYGAADGDYYYQQRWNASDLENAPLVGELLREAGFDADLSKRWAERLSLEEMLPKRVVSLSSGELRKFLIAKSLSGGGRVLIVESPFIGLDREARTTLRELFASLVEEGVQFVLMVSSPEDIPPFITHVYTIEDRTIGPKQTLAEFRHSERFSALRREKRELYDANPPRLPAPQNRAGEWDEVARLRNVTIRYGDRTVLHALDWTVRRGEKWALLGGNGSGKTTLLSLISADNPMAYAHDIVLFDRPRGSGESIWDIKRRIGYVSPEMHRSYTKPVAAEEVVASGFFDSVGLYRRPSEEQLAICRDWMHTFQADRLVGRLFTRLSSGEQRLLLLARAFVKDPQLLILDEPLHGLDGPKKELARGIIDAFCEREGKTLIYVTHYENELPACIDRRLVLPRRG